MTTGEQIKDLLMYILGTDSDIYYLLNQLNILLVEDTKAINDNPSNVYYGSCFMAKGTHSRMLTLLCDELTESTIIDKYEIQFNHETIKLRDDSERVKFSVSIFYVA
jgi:hypothetical protein